MENQFSNLSNYSKPQSPKKKAFLYVIIFAVLIGGAIFAGNYFLSDKKSSDEPQAVPTVTPTDTPIPTPTASASASPTPTGKVTSKVTPTQSTKVTPTTTTSSKTLDIEVLNGSGTSGMASKVALLLKSNGYTITSTGNAETFDYPQTVIQLKKSKTTFGAQLKKDLSVSYTVDPTIQTLAETATSDAIVIVGAK